MTHSVVKLAEPALGRKATNQMSFVVAFDFEQEQVCQPLRQALTLIALFETLDEVLYQILLHFWVTSEEKFRLDFLLDIIPGQVEVKKGPLGLIE